MDPEIAKSIQSYQSIVLLDLLIEFREEFIRRIVSRWLRAEFMPESYRRLRYEKSIREYFGRKDLATKLKADFKTWRQFMDSASEASDTAFDEFASELEERLATIKIQFEHFQSVFPALGTLADDPESDFERDNIDRIRERVFVLNELEKVESRRVGLAIDAFLRTPQMRSHLHPGDGTGKQTFGLLAMFNIVLLAVDNSNATEISGPDAVKRYAGSRFHYMLPPHDLLFKDSEESKRVRDETTPALQMDGRYSFQTFFPLVSVQDAKQLEDALKELEAKCNCVLDQSLVPLDTPPMPALFRGINTFVYDSSYAKGLMKQHCDGGVPIDVWTLSRNVNFIQLVPNPKEQIFGFFQLQSSLPGFVRALFPSEECGKTPPTPEAEGWRRLYFENNIVTASPLPGRSLHDNVALCEMPRLDVLWGAGHLGAKHEEHDYILEGIHWMRHSNTPWSKRFYNQMVYLDRFKQALWEAIEPKINRQYREQLERLSPHLEEMLSALSTLQQSTSQVRAIVKDPTDAIFGIHQVAGPLFDETSGDLHVTADFCATIKHKPDDYEAGNDNDVRSLRSVMALLLLRWTGFLDDTRKLTFHEFIGKAMDRLDEYQRSSALSNLIPLVCRILSGQSSGVPQASELLKEGYPFECLKIGARAAKCLLFTPFKADANEVGALPIAVAAGREEIFVKGAGASVSYSCGDENILSQKLAFKSGQNPVHPREIIQLLLGIVGEARNRREPIRVQQVSVCLPVPGEDEQAINVFFEGDYREGIVDALKANLNKSLFATPRDWRIESGSYGNFTAPYMRLANRLLGVNEEWIEDLVQGDEVVALKRKDGSKNQWRRFSLSIGVRNVTLNWKPLHK